MMLSRRLGKDTAVPWWAAFGAPLLGVPLLVALLAIGSTADADSVGMDGKAGVAVEQVDGRSAKTTMELQAKLEEYEGTSRC